MGFDCIVSANVTSILYHVRENNDKREEEEYSISPSLLW